MLQRNRYLFAYDISDARQRRKVRQLLQAYAVGGQKSLFECSLSERELTWLCTELPGMIDAGDRLHVARLSDSLPPFLFGRAQPLRYEYFLMA